MAINTSTRRFFPLVVLLLSSFSLQAGVEPITAYPFTEGFESGFPDGFTQDPGIPTWNVRTGNGSAQPAAAHSGVSNICLRDSTALPNINMLYLPEMDLTSLSSPTLSFWHTQQRTTTYDSLVVLYKSSAEGAWTQIARYTASVTSWTLRTLALPNRSATYYIAFLGNAKAGNGVCIDDIIVTSKPSVPVRIAPTNGITKLTLTPTFSWNASTGPAPITYRIQVSTNTTFTANVIDDSTLVATSYVTPPGTLAAFTTYYWRVNAKNAGGTSAWASRWTLRTDAPPVLAAIGDKSVGEGAALSFTVTATDADGTTPARSVTLLPEGAVFTPATGLFSWTPTFDQAGSYEVQFKATDGVLTDSQTITITVTSASLPDVPALSSPANGATGVALSSTLSWSAASGATSYHVQLATDAGFTSLIVNDSTLVATSKAVSSLSGSTTHYWRVKAINGAGASAWTAAWDFITVPAIPAAPVRIAPANGITRLSLMPTYSWNASAGAATYRIQVSTNTTFTANVIDDSTLVATSYVTPPGTLAAFTTYYWRVNAKNAGGTSVWPARWYLKTDALPVLAAIGNKSVDEAATLSFTVTATDADATTPTLAAETLPEGATFTPATGAFSWSPTYEQSGSYEVLFTATDGVYTDSETITITVNNISAEAPVLVAPADAATDISLSTVFLWHPATGATTYHLQTATDAGFASLVVNDSLIADTTKSVSGLTASTTYYWRARTINISGASVWTAARTFTTVPAAPVAPVRIAPTHGVTKLTLTPTFSWNASAGAATYRIQVSTNITFTANVIDDSTLVATSYVTPPGTLAAFTTYYWRVNAKNAGGTSAWPTRWTLKTDALPVLAAIGNKSVDEAATLSFTVTATDADATTPTLAAETLPEGASFTTATGAFSWTPTFEQFGSYDVLFTATDGVYTDSETITITVNNISAEAPVLVAPADAATDVNLSTVFLWHPATGATTYHLQTATDAGFASLVVNDSLIADTTKSVSGLTASTTYYWRARTINTSGASVWAAARTFTTVPAAPVAPVRIAPTHGVTKLTLTPTFSWNASAGAATYRIQVSTNITFTANVIDDSTLVATSYVTPPGTLAAFTTYYWRVNAKNAGGTSAWPTRWTLRTDALPVLAAIGNKSVDEAATLSFTVTATDADATTPTLAAETLPEGATFTPATGAFSWSPTYEQSGSYEVLFTATDGVYTDSETITITVNNISAEAPVLVAPADAATDISLSTVFLWHPATGATTYHLQTATDAGFASLVVNDSLIADTTKSVSGLTASTTYYWRARTINISGASVWTAARTFTTVPAAPVAPVRIAPTNGITKLSLTPTFSWNASAGAATYRIQVSTNITFTANVIDDSTLVETSYVTPPGTLAAFTTYYWRVNAKNAGGTSAWPTRWYLKTDAPPVLAGITDTVIYRGDTVLLTVSATDADGTMPVLSAIDKPATATFTDHGNGTGSFVWLQTRVAAGAYSATFVATDGVLHDTGSFQITVNSDRAPVFAACAAQNAIIGTTAEFNVTASDPDNDPLSLTAIGSPLTAGAQFVDNGDNSATFTWKPGLDQAGDYEILFIADDGVVRDSMYVTVQVRETGLVGNWRFEEPYGTVAYDLSGNWHHGNLSGGATRAADVPARISDYSASSLKLDSGKQYVYVTCPGYLNDYTVSLWLKINPDQTFANPALFNYGDSCAMLMLQNERTLTFYAKDSAGLKHIGGQVLLDYDTWYGVVAQVKGDSLKLFVDGVNVGTGTKNSGLSKVYDGNIWIGAAYVPGIGKTDYFNGWIDDIRLYNRALDNSEIARTNESGLPPIIAPLADAGNDTTDSEVLLSHTFALRGQAVDDSLNPSDLIVRWRQISGPAIVRFNDSTSLTSAAEFDSAGTYSLQLAVSDSVYTSYDTVSLSFAEATVDLTNGLVGEWQFEESSGTIAIDKSGYYHNGIITGATRVTDVPPAIAGSSTTSLQLSGTFQYVKAAGTGYYDNYTMALWVKRDMSQIISNPRFFDYGDRRGVLYFSGATSLYFAVKNNTGVQTSIRAIVANDGNWHHIAAKLKGDTMGLFIDGAIAGQNVKSGALSTVDSVVYLGGENGASCLKGNMDDVLFFSRAINNTELATLCRGRAVAQNVAPFCDAGRDTVLTEAVPPVTVLLKGYVLDEQLLKSQLTIGWQQVDGPGVVTFGNPATDTTNATFSAGGLYRLQLAVSDGLLTRTDTVEVSIDEAPLNLGSGVIAHWNLDDTAAAIAADISGNSHDGAIFGGAALSADVPLAIEGSSTASLHLSGTGQYVKADGIGLYDEYTFSLWVKRDSPQVTSNPRFIDYGDHRCLLYYAGYSALYYVVKNATGIETSVGVSIVSDTAWHHIAAKLKGDSLQLFVDGVLAGTRTKSGPLSTVDSVIYIGAENAAVPLKGCVDDVQMFGRALTNAEILALYQGYTASPPPGAPLSLSFTDAIPGDLSISGDITSLSSVTDLSTLVPWGDNTVAGTTAFINETVAGRQRVYLTAAALANAGTSASSSLRTFTSRDYVFPRAIGHDTEIVTIEFYAKWDTASHMNDSSYFSVTLMDNYPSNGVNGADTDNFNGDPYGTPALTARLRPSIGSDNSSFLMYGGAGSGSFDNYNNQWWLPGSVSPVPGSASMVPGIGSEYPYSSWNASSAPLGDTMWTRYTYRIRPDRQELYRNDTLFCMMELPASSFVAPVYRYYGQFKAMRMAWIGGAQCYVGDLAVSASANVPTPNLSPAVSITLPGQDTTVTPGSGAHLVATAFDEDGTISKVEFYSNGVKLGEDYTAPYEYSWQSVPAGVNYVSVYAVDDQGAVTAARGVVIQSVAE